MRAARRSEDSDRALRIRAGSRFQVAVTTTRPEARTSRATEPAPRAAPEVLAGVSRARVRVARRGEMSSASVRPTASTGHTSLAPGVPRYTAWRLKRTQVPGVGREP